MKIRIKPESRGTKGVDWERYYLIQIKTFLFWSNWKEIKTLDQASEILEVFNVSEIEYRIF